MTVLNPVTDNPSRYLVTESETAFNGQNTLRKKLCKLIEPVPTRNNKTPLLVNRILRDELCVADMCHRIKDDAYHRRQRSKTFLYLIPLVSLFYLVPSSQMVFAEQRRAKDSGNQETCYLNYGCSRAYWGFDDFNVPLHYSIISAKYAPRPIPPVSHDYFNYFPQLFCRRQIQALQC